MIDTRVQYDAYNQVFDDLGVPLHPMFADIDTGQVPVSFSSRMNYDDDTRCAE